MTFSGSADSVSLRLSYSWPLGEGARGAVTVNALDSSSSELGRALQHPFHCTKAVPAPEQPEKYGVARERKHQVR